MKVTIYFKTNDYKESLRIRSQYNLHCTLTVNGEIVCDVNSDTLQSLKGEETSGFIEIRNKK